ncbi:hypothetical protein [Candidatus Soleaferrea massiliensis]|uniref:hypothetical protein n=1 Tax=Candidatus Soleaferrea massiliensis TaxID=1470354 RepID=UPI000590FA1D|nr:hypothetical protein [Candidatus Soleaferrea massiliensis]
MNEQENLREETGETQEIDEQQSVQPEEQDDESEYMTMTYGEAVEKLEGYEDDEIVQTTAKAVVHTVERERVRFHRLIWWGAFLLAVIVMSGAYGIMTSMNNLLFSIFAVGAAIACAFGVWKVWMGLYVDYKYAVKNGFFEIQQVNSGRKVIPMVKFDCKRITRLAPYDSNVNRQDYNYVLEACISPRDPSKNNTWVIEMKDRTKGQTLILFNPNEEILEAIRARMNEYDEVYDGVREE